jgi:hypothetical protein
MKTLYGKHSKSPGKLLLLDGLDPFGAQHQQRPGPFRLKAVPDARDSQSQTSLAPSQL